MLNIVKGAFGVVDGEQPEYEITMVGGGTPHNEKDQTIFLSPIMIPEVI